MIGSTAQRAPQLYLSTSSYTQSEGMNAIRVALNDSKPVALSDARQQIARLNWFTANWDGYGSQKPDYNAVESARTNIVDLYHAAALTEIEWVDPHVGANEDGLVVLEWWKDPKKITLYVSSDDATYVRVWGDDMDLEMDEGRLQNLSEFEALWQWLHT